MPTSRRFGFAVSGQCAGMASAQILLLTATLLLMVVTAAWVFREEP